VERRYFPSREITVLTAFPKRVGGPYKGVTAVNQAAVYDESKIKTLSSLEHIRLRTGMYIGRLGDGSNLDDGIYILLKEIGYSSR